MLGARVTEDAEIFAHMNALRITKVHVKNIVVAHLVAVVLSDHHHCERLAVRRSKTVKLAERLERKGGLLRER